MPKTGGTHLKTGPAAWVAMLLPAALTAVVALPLYAYGVIGLEGVGAIGLVTALPALLLSFRHWRRLDEPSREAHKFAFLWGWGCAGAVVGLLGLVLLYFPGPRDLVQGWIEGFIAVSKGLFGTQQGAVGVYLTIFVAMLVQALAYLVVWIGWWARQRMGTKAD